MREWSEKQAELDSEWYRESNYLDLLAVENEEELLIILAKANAKDISYSIFREPDLDDEITAIVLEPGLDNRRICHHIKLMGQ